MWPCETVRRRVIDRLARNVSLMTDATDAETTNEDPHPTTVDLLFNDSRAAVICLCIL